VAIVHATSSVVVIIIIIIIIIIISGGGGFPRQKPLRESTPLLHYSYNACLVDRYACLITASLDLHISL
jgi:hypothetical protein